MFCSVVGQATPRGPCAGAGTAYPDHPDKGVHLTAGAPCPVGHFCPVGLGMPLPCPAGTFSDRMFLSMSSECLPCPPGHFCSASGLSAPSGPCAPGYFCLAGVSSPTPTGLSGHGGPCPQGHFCPRGTSFPQPCRAGSYSSLPGQASCFPCPAGYYCPENITSYSGYPCPAGFYCPRGTKHAAQFPCPRGYYNPDSLTHSLDSCLPCPPGHYCGQENLTKPSGACDAGWYCVSAAWTARPFDLDNYTSTNCLCPATATGGKCPAGSYCPEGSPEPTPCPPGFFCATSGLSTPTGSCQAGYFCTGGSESPAPEDEVTGGPCPPGFFCSAASHKPIPCPAGTFSSLPEQTASSTCQTCPSGFYCKEAGLQAPSGWCPAGYYCDSSSGPVQDFSLYPCPRGYYCPVGTAKAMHHSCPVGTYGPQKGLTSITECQLCPAGKFCSRAGITAPTGVCAAGHWCKAGASRKDPTDGAGGLRCPPGHYCLEGAPVPAPCPPGTWSSEGTRAPEGCQQCSVGQLCPGGLLPTWPTPCFLGVPCTGGTAPAILMESLSGRSCLPGHFCPWGMVDITPCPPGSYASHAAATECLICPSGRYCVPGMRPQLCPRGFFCSEGTGLDWQPCPPGTYGYEPGLNSLAECRACDGGRFCPRANATEAGGQCWEGFFCTRGSTRPNPEAGTEENAGPCPPGHHCPRGSALPQPCPPGTFGPWTKLGSEAACSPCLPGHYCASAGLAHPSGPCSEGFFCLQGALVPNNSLEDGTSGPCPAGHFCPSGTVSPKPCPAGTHNALVAQGRCQPCPQGFFCPANTSSVAGNECPAGHYCPASTTFASQFPCPRGTYKPQRGGVHRSDCSPCEPGKGPTVSCLGWLPHQGSVVLGSTAIMEHLSRIPLMGLQETSVLQATSVPREAPILFHVPLVCAPAGSLLTMPGATSVKDCQPCPAGWFCSQAGLSSPEALCEGGWYCPQASVSGHSPDTICPLGHSCPPGSLEPRACPPGQYQDEPGQSFCKMCPAGKFCPSGILEPGTRTVTPVDCPAGYYCPLGTQHPTQHPCPGGTFRERPGAQSAKDCRPCPAGQFCADSGTGKRFPDGPCLAGYYCPPGQTSATPTSFRCPQGFYCPEGSLQPKACGNGTFQPQEAQGSCEVCPMGFYCEASSTDLVTMALAYASKTISFPGSHSATARPCPQGTFGPRPGATTELDCEPCPAGMFCVSQGLTQPSGLCHSGHYCTGGAVSPTPIQHKVEGPGFSGNDICPPGFFCPMGTGFPLPCPPGFYSSARGLNSKDQCQPCPLGHYCGQPGLSQVLEASLCHAGYICLGGSTVPSPTDGTHGYRCPPGFYCPPGAHHELPCKPGTFSPLSGADTCLSCPQGTYCPKAATVEPITCPKGHYCPAGTPSAHPCPEGTLNPQESAVSPRACQLCPAGSYCPGEGNTWPEGPCSAGYYCKGGAASPTPQGDTTSPLNGPCPRGHYCPQGSVFPVPCPLGTTRNLMGGTSKGSCRPCPDGYFCPSLDLGSANGSCTVDSDCSLDTSASTSTPVPCPQGHFCQPGAAWPVLCHRGHYQSSLGSDTCLSCPPGSYCPYPGTQTPRPCPAHAYCQAGTWSPSLCPPGTFTPQDVSGLQEDNDCSICPPGHYCRRGQVWGRCPAGYFCSAGTSEITLDPSKPQASCTQKQLCAQQCPPGFYCPEGSGEPIPCPPHTLAATAGAQKKEDCGPCPPGQWCKAETQARKPCPAGHYCPGMSESHPGAPQACPEHTYLATEGGQSPAECLPCPTGYHCPWPGLSSFEDHPCPPGHWCPGAQGAFLCPPGTFRSEPGASSPQDCELCPSGYYCPDTQVTGRANVFAIPCQPGSECPAGAVDMVPCRAGSYCGPRTGVPPLCPGGFACPEGSSTYTGPGQRCMFPHYCPQGSTHPLGCPGGSEAQNKSGLRVSAETSCRLCTAGTYRSPALDTLTCQPCPPGFICPQGSESYDNQPCPVGHYCPEGTSKPRPCPAGTFGGSSQAAGAEDCQPCPPGTFSARPGQAACLPCGSVAFSPQGASTCTCRGLNRIFQKSDGSCLCQAGHVSYDHRGLETDQESNSHSDEDCQPQVAQHCPPGDVRLAATRECVSPQQYDCSSFCGPGGGKLSTALGICQCLGYVSAEELCDIRCLANAPRLSLSWDPGKELILSVKSRTGDSIQKELLETLGPDLQFPGSARVHLVQFGPHGTLGFIISRVDMLISLLQGTATSGPWLQRHHRTTGRKHPNTNLQIPNPVICLAAGDVILFQLHLLAHNRSASHYPMYQRQHLLNSNSHWDSGAFRRLGHLVRETNLSLSGFAHQFLDPGTYVFQDNGKPENIAVVLVKEEGAACGAGLSPVQPSSPYQLGRLGVLRHSMLTLGPDWAVITGVLLAAGLATALLTGLGLLLKPAVPQACPTKSWGSQWRSVGQPPTPAVHVTPRDNLLSYEDLEEADSREKDMTRGAGEPPQALTLEDFSVRTLYDKLEDQSLHVAAQLSRHREDALAFYRAASQQLQGLQDFLQGTSLTELPSLVKDKHPEPGVKTRRETVTGESEEPQEARASHTASSRTDSWQLAPGCTPSISPLGFQPELSRTITALASALSRAREPPVGASRKASSQHDEQSSFTSQRDSPMMGQPPFNDQEPQSTRPQQAPEPLQIPKQDVKGRDAQTLSPEKGILGAGLRRRPDIELQKKTWQVEEALDELNEEFFWLSAQILELQKEDGKLDRLCLGEDNTSVGTQALMLEVQRIHLAQRIEDLEWELSLLLQTSNSSSRAEGSRSSHSASQQVPESPWMQRWPPVGCTFYTKDTTTSLC
uniref:Predicted gene 9195 n=2 Tax=Peromyscus maniculatus bairdii TaxID=230844 RepID=A0A8C8VT86_PERMB